MPAKDDWRFETLAVHAGAAPDPVTGAVRPAIHLSTTFERAPDGTFPSGYTYIRDANPNRQALETALARLEGGAVGGRRSPRGWRPRAPSSSPSRPAITWSRRSTRTTARPSCCASTSRAGAWTVSFVDMTDLAAAARRGAPATRLVWMETPSNPTIAVTDLAAVVGDRARRGRPHRLRQHLGHAVPAASARARRRPRPCTRPRSTCPATRT